MCFVDVEASIGAINEVLDSFEAEQLAQNALATAEITPSSQEEGVDIEHHIVHLIRLESALNTLKTHTTWKNVPSTLQRLEALHKRALQNLYQLFDIRLSKSSTLTENNLPSPSLLNELKRLASYLTPHSHDIPWVTIYVQRRAQWLMEGVKHALGPNITSSSLPSSTLSPYIRGTHHFIRALHTLLRRLDIERHLCTALFSSPSERCEVYRRVVTPALDMWAKASDLLLDHLLHQHRHTHQPLPTLPILCDLWDSLHKTLPQFEQILSSEFDKVQSRETEHPISTAVLTTVTSNTKESGRRNHNDVDNDNDDMLRIERTVNSRSPSLLLVNHITEFWASLTSITRECFAEFRTQIQSNSADRIPPDGTVSALTTSTLNALLALVPYSDCMIHLLPPLPSVPGK
jgi:hypothetical protein